MRILFIGCVESSYRLLEALLASHKDVTGVVTKESAGSNADFSDVEPLCRDYKVPIIKVKNINDSESVQFIKERKADIGFCFGWSQLVKEDVINSFPMGMVGFHPAELPHNRGRHPIIWALALGLEQTASTFFMLEAGADEGAIVSQRPVKIDYADDARTLYDKIMDIAVEQELGLVDAFAAGSVVMTPQVISDGNVWRKRGKADGCIDWRMSGRNIYNLVRSLTKPYVGAHFVFNGEEYKVWKCEELSGEWPDNLEPGKVLCVDDKGIVIKAGEGAVRIIEHDDISVKEGEYIL